MQGCGQSVLLLLFHARLLGVNKFLRLKKLPTCLASSSKEWTDRLCIKYEPEQRNA